MKKIEYISEYFILPEAFVGVGIGSVVNYFVTGLSITETIAIAVCVYFGFCLFNLYRRK